MVFPAVLASGRADEMGALAASCGAFAAFSCAASGVYCINDARDWRTDQQHPIKRRRPIASGELAPSAGYLAGLVWLAAGFAIAGLAVGSIDLLAVLAGYVVLQAFYNGWLKRIAGVDLITLALGFVLRAMAGAAAIEVPVSLWLLLSVLFLCLYLAGIKRLCDLISMERGPESGWESAGGYRKDSELTWILIVSASLALMTFEMYAMSDHVLEVVGPEARGFVLLTPFAIIAMYRFYRSARAGVSDSPIRLALTDPVLLISGILFLAGAAVVIYVPATADLLQRYFSP